jgi:acetoacetyl-CoA synthetase
MYLVVSGDPTIPVYAGEIQAPALGMAVDVYDAAASTGRSIRRTGHPGELVCTQPFPSQPVMFWGDGPAAKRYRASYFERFGDGVWCQGDFLARNPSTGGYVMLGRS